MALSDGAISAIAGAGSSLVGGIASIFQANANRRENQRVRDEDRSWALQDYQREKSDNLEMWHMQNEYNSPDQQRRRLEEAGYNPALALGDVNSVGSADSPPDAPDTASPGQDAFEAPTPHFDVAGNVSQMVSALSGLESLKGQQYDNQLKAKTLPFSVRQRKNEADASGSLVRQVESSIMLNMASAHAQRSLARVNARLAELHSAQEGLVKQHTSESEARTTNLGSETALNQQLGQESAARTSKIPAEIRELEARRDYLEKQILRYDKAMDSQIGMQGAQTELFNKQAGRVGKQDIPWTIDDDVLRGRSAGSRLNYGIERFRNFIPFAR